MEKCHLKVQYSRCGYKHLDEQYFLRSNAEIPLKLNAERYWMKRFLPGTTIPFW